MRNETMLNAIKVMEERLAAGRVAGGIAGFPTVAERFEQDFENVIKLTNIPREIAEVLYYMGCTTVHKMVTDITDNVNKGLFTEEQGGKLYMGIAQEIKLTALREVAKSITRMQDEE